MRCLPAVVCALAGSASAQRAADGELRVTLVTVGPGSELFSWAGHTAIIVDDPRSSGPILFDYGVMMADAQTLASIVRGKPELLAVAHEPVEELTRWRAAGRSVWSTPLRLTAAEGLELRARLVADERSDHRGALYDLQRNNCTSRIRDLIDSVAGGALRRAGNAATGRSSRAMFYGYLPASWQVVAFDLLLNGDADAAASDWDAAIFPEHLAGLISKAGLGSAEVPTSRGLPWNPAAPLATRTLLWLVAGMSIAMLLILLRRGGASALLVGSVAALGCGVAGLLGLVLVYDWLLTGYLFAPRNENLLLLDPLLLLGVPLGVAHACGVRNAITWLHRLAQLSLLLAAIALLSTVRGAHQDIHRLALLVIPALLGLAALTQPALPRHGVLTARPHGAGEPSLPHSHDQPLES